MLITNPNPEGSIYYTLDGSNPDTNAQLWNGTPVFIFQSAVLRARAFRNGYLPSLISSGSYLFSISH
ncbi:MAG: FN3 associated domain-containing protein, partial [Candidatus Fonsibacter sp.]